MLLIFPSFMAHGTVPTGVPDARLCLSLDVIPCDPLPGDGEEAEPSAASAADE